MSSLRDKLIKNSTVKLTTTIDQSKIFDQSTKVTTKIPAINIAFSGEIDGGFTSGLTLWCGKSKHFKSLYQLIMAKAYMDKFPDAVLLFYDNEFGTPRAYFESLKFDMDRVVYTPVMNIEELKFDIVQQLEGIDRGDRVFIAVDSIGNLASKKEVEDAKDQKSVADMTRAKAIKSLFRIVTPYLTVKDIPMSVVNHIYMTQEMFSKAVVSGGDGIYLSADNIFIIGRQQEKDGSDIAGWNFIINVEKSRHSREKSKIPVQVMYDSGLNTWSGLLEIALEGNFVAKPKNGWYCKVDDDGVLEDKNYRLKDTNNKEFWLPILSNKRFRDYVKSEYAASANELMTSDEEQEIDELVADTDSE